MEFATPQFWLAGLEIIVINILLSGDNAVVIALAARSLPPRQQKAAVLWGSGAAVVMSIVLTIFAVALLTLPWLKLVGSLLLFWIGVKLLVPKEGDEDIDASDNLIAAIKTILIADLVMSIDNVIAVAAAAQGSYLLLMLGNLLGLVLTLGLFYPWAKVRTARYAAEHISLQAGDDLDDFVAARQQDVSSLGGEMGEMFDVSVGL